MPRFTIDIDDKFNETLNNLVKDTSASTKAEVIRNAVAVYSYLKANAKPEAGGMQVVSMPTKNGETAQVMIP